MEVKTRLYTVDDVWEMLCQPGSDRGYELIDGELIEMAPTNSLHSLTGPEVSALIRNFAKPRKLGYTISEGGFSASGDEHLLLAPDLAFVRSERMPIPFPKPFFNFMPDLAVEIKSPGNSTAELRRKARIFLSNGSSLVWIIDPQSRCAEVWQLDADGGFDSEVLGSDGSLSGGDVLPGFVLPLSEIFPAQLR